MKMLILAAVMVVCAAPALAQADQVARVCDQDPETTGALAADPRSLYLPGERPVRPDPDPPEVSWQDQARENAEWRKRYLLGCGVD
jgi:hypothetical protein